MNEDDIDPAASPWRRSFTAEYKAEILAEYDLHPKGSEAGARSCAARACTARISRSGASRPPPEPARLARKSKKRRTAEEIELEKLRRQNERLAAELAKTKTALEITGKVHALLEQLSESADTETKSKP